MGEAAWDMLVVLGIGIVGGLTVPIIIIVLSATGNFEPLEFHIFGRVVKIGKPKP